MTELPDPLARELTERVSAATPSTLPPFGEVARRARRQRLRNGLAVAASVAVVAGIAGFGWLASRNGEAAPPTPIGTPTAVPDESRSPVGPTPAPRVPTPSVDPRYPSGITLRLSGQEVEMPADTSCWRGDRPEDCRRGLLYPGPGPEIGTHDAIEFSFAEQGWEFHAQLREMDVECPRVTTVEATPTGDRSFRLEPAGDAGRYEVDLRGSTTDAMASTKFVWTTTVDGPSDPPSATFGMFANSRGAGSFALELDYFDLGYTPEVGEVSPFAEARITGRDGTVTTWRIPLVPQSMDCEDYGRGNFYYQGEWDEDYASLGGSPFEVVVTTTLRGTTYVGRSTYERVKGASSMLPVTFVPSLPASP